MKAVRTIALAVWLYRLKPTLRTAKTAPPRVAIIINAIKLVR